MANSSHKTSTYTNMKHYDAIQIHNEESDVSPGVPSPDNPNPEDHLTPCFDCPREDRPSTVIIGTFNLIASIVGGVSFYAELLFQTHLDFILTYASVLKGVLSLPIVFSKCGIFFTTISMTLSAYITYMSLSEFVH